MADYDKAVLLMEDIDSADGVSAVNQQRVDWMYKVKPIFVFYHVYPFVSQETAP
jgi:hypothetical protein